ncbi:MULTISPECIES: FadR/GntR family transcriptional regulator [unclassified Paenibacillus]|uniref:FadR/GntR family transcriptional regulator n=1 Tax=unclassified Paenibacillus TaxID=185978 RepID=UPI001AEB5678|nr:MULTISPECIES: FadR/GntR family transcriptional regulator [unclassified Paenibacillus]MBP1154898.1 GntR family transcriptional repressor for pyruvate dehydrogenase complex [Paenibacillus sp. PvP091]MBP1169718.1 GntR family transcriptional repressor for pyruvate dehydrogenase complex [Paenibacillus sp. PvR098]MBP2440746.1 GntR family transcriptional repressor for pyruvate dehydrogenase complex [Paenibacillus sp. PvP052]
MINPLIRTPVTEEALEQVMELIHSGKVKVGERLPTETQLSSMLGISRSTAREVFITLQAQGFIEIKRGKGAFVIDSSDFYERKFIEWFQKNEIKIHQLLEVRMTIEPYSALIASQKITDDDIIELEKIQENFIQAIQAKKVEDMIALDEGFHLKIIKVCQNELLEFFYSNVIPVLQEYRRNVFSPPADPTLAIKPHYKIIQALKERDAQKTYDAMIDHIKASKTDVTGKIRKIVSSTKHNPN